MSVKKMKDTTFGSFPAAIKLVEILNGNPEHVSRKVCTAINDYKSTLESLKDIKDVRIRRKMRFLWKEEAKKIIEKLELPDEVNRFTLNVESTFFKIAQKEQ